MIRTQVNPPSVSTVIVLIVLGTAMAAVLAACGTTTVAQNEETTPVTVESTTANVGTTAEEGTNSQPVSEVFFPKLQPSDGLPPSARIRGELVLDEEGCLRIDGGADTPDTLPLWPSYFELSAEGDEIHILDGEGDFVARVGGRIVTGGGRIHQGGTQQEVFENLQRLVGETTARQLRERCPGPYWLVGPGEDHIQR